MLFILSSSIFVASQYIHGTLACKLLAPISLLLSPLPSPLIPPDLLPCSPINKPSHSVVDETPHYLHSPPYALPLP